MNQCPAYSCVCTNQCPAYSCVYECVRMLCVCVFVCVRACVCVCVCVFVCVGAICQENGLVPIIEPEVLMDGNHDIEKVRFREPTHPLHVRLQAECAQRRRVCGHTTRYLCKNRKGAFS